MSDYIERKSIRNLYSCLDPEDEVRVAQVLIDIDAIPPAEVVPKGSDEASLAYAEGWENGEEAERSRHKMNATGDLIERDKAINAIRCHIKDIDGDDDALDYIATNMLKDVPSARPKGEWIPCSDRLPEDIRPVLVTWKNTDPASYYQYIVGKHFIGTAHYHRGKWYWYSSVAEDLLAEYGKCETEEFDEAIEAVAWMPLPQPWKGADDE